MLNTEHIQIDSAWKAVLAAEFNQPYMQQLRDFLIQEKRNGKTIYPPSHEIFTAFNLTPFNKVRVVIIGQDPYHGSKQAHGLCFSVRNGTALPPSLKNIYKEITQELGVIFNENGCLTPWAEQGVLLLNSVLTVEHNCAASHQGKGWEQFTDKIISLLNDKHENLVFLLWGKYAQNKGSIIDNEKHLVLTSPHPSPFAAYRGFFGNEHFKKTNAFLKAKGKKIINWQI